jgi:cytochrome oxidase Cu insertion factor (SCO1/SenC/PrrC family)
VTTPAVNPSKTRSRITLILVFVVFIAPVAGAWLYFYFGSSPEQKNFGELYHPARPFLSALTLNVQDSGKLDADTSGAWTIMYVNHGPCEEACVGQLDKINRVRLTRGKNIKRVALLFVTDRALNDARKKQIEGVYPGAIATANAASQMTMAQLLSHDSGDKDKVVGRIYLIDPIGNLVLSYTAEQDARNIIRDLARLLRVSQIG